MRIAGLLVVLGMLALSTQAQTIGGTFAGGAVITFVPGLGYSRLDLNFTGSGDDTAFGPFTASSQMEAAFNASGYVISDGMLTETFSAGTLFGTASGTYGAPDTFTIDFAITGGTGEFLGDTGEAIVTGTSFAGQL